MNNKRYNQIIDKAYENYLQQPLATISDDGKNLLYNNLHKGWCIMTGRSFAYPHPTRHLTEEEFINKCKTDSEFSQEFALKIEERKLSLEERLKIHTQIGLKRGSLITPCREMTDNEWWHEVFDKSNVPTKLITILYNNEIVEVYE